MRMIRKTIALSALALMMMSCGDREKKQKKFVDDDPPTAPHKPPIEYDNEPPLDGDWQVINSPCIRIMSFYNNQYFSDTKRCGNRIQRSTGLFTMINDGMITLSYKTSVCKHLNGTELMATYRIDDETIVLIEHTQTTILKKVTSKFIDLAGDDQADVGQNSTTTGKRRKDCPKPTIELPPYKPKPEVSVCIDVSGNGNTTIVGDGNSGNSSSGFIDKVINNNTNINTNTNTNKNTNSNDRNGVNTNVNCSHDCGDQEDRPKPDYPPEKKDDDPPKGGYDC